MNKIVIENIVAKCPTCEDINSYRGGYYEPCIRCGETFNPCEHETGENYDTVITTAG